MEWTVDYAYHRNVGQVYHLSIHKQENSSDVINSLMQKWDGVFGLMGLIMTDNCGEFSSDEMREVMSILNVKVITTAAESPFRNGLCERLHAFTDRMLLKLQEENEQTRWLDPVILGIYGKKHLTILEWF